MELESIAVKPRGNEDFAESRKFAPLVREKIRFRVGLTGLSIPFDGKVRVTVSRDTTDGLTAVAGVEVPICSDTADATVNVVWDGEVDRTVPRQVSTRTTPNLNPGASPTNIPLREMDQGDFIRHGVYVVERSS